MGSHFFQQKAAYRKRYAANSHSRKGMFQPHVCQRRFAWGFSVREPFSDIPYHYSMRFCRLSRHQSVPKTAAVLPGIFFRLLSLPANAGANKLPAIEPLRAFLPAGQGLCSLTIHPAHCSLCFHSLALRGLPFPVCSTQILLFLQTPYNLQAAYCSRYASGAPPAI